VALLTFFVQERGVRNSDWLPLNIGDFAFVGVNANPRAVPHPSVAIVPGSMSSMIRAYLFARRGSARSGLDDPPESIPSALQPNVLLVTISFEMHCLVNDAV